MKHSNQDTFLLDNFEGPLDYLLHLVQKSEIDIYDVCIKKITGQFFEKHCQTEVPSIENGAEFIGIASTLLWYKSKTLLPQHEQTLDSDEEDPDPRFDMIHQLIDYCRFKEAAKELSEREQQQSAFYLRGMDGTPDVKKNLGIAHLSLDDLASLFQGLLSKSKVHTGHIEEETWRVSDKIKSIRQLLKQPKGIEFEQLFSAERSKEELIVTFLAILELMKLGEIWIIKEELSTKIMIVKPQDYHG